MVISIAGNFEESEVDRLVDKYFGNLAIVFGFRDENTASVRMSKKAEAFLDEYEGVMNAATKEA